jgi:hypothetical protein
VRELGLAREAEAISFGSFTPLPPRNLSEWYPTEARQQEGFPERGFSRRYLLRDSGQTNPLLIFF